MKNSINFPETKLLIIVEMLKEKIDNDEIRA
jgi:hypothetical protein